MRKEKMKYSIIVLFCFILGSCTIFQLNKSKLTEITDGAFKMEVNTRNLQFRFTDRKGNTIVPNDTVSGLFINESPVVRSEIQSKSANKIILSATTKEGEEAQVDITFENGIAKVTVAPSAKGRNKVSLHLGGMPVAHGLGDVAAFGEGFNIVKNKREDYDIDISGANRWVSSFVIFPQNNIAGVFFNKGKKTVVLNEQKYVMNSTTAETATFYYFLGTPAQIYKKYKSTREREGYTDVKPKFRLFELGWESWDALGWNTNQKTVQETLQKFHDNGYPIRWAVTGSGFWDVGGTTTSFGKWGKKFPDAVSFKNWMHSKDIKWMIGLRTNFIPEGGPYYPKTKKRDKNLKVSSFYGNALSTEAEEKGYLVKDARGEILKITSSIFPIVPCYLLDGNVPGAAEWYQQQYAKWDVDGIKEDTMMEVDSLTGIFNAPIAKIAEHGGLVMAKNGEIVSPGTLLRINDTGVGNITKRLPINYFQYAASGFPNVYSDVAGIHNMHNLKQVDKNIRHTWLLSLTAGIAVGAYPEKWSEEKQKVFKKAIDFHYKLAPYMYSTAIDGYHSGYPTTLTPMTIAFPQDKLVDDLHNFEWMIGKSVLATPLLKNHKAGKMDVYLPEGVWFDYETGKKYEGAQTLKDFEIPLDKTPIFIGGEGIIVERISEEKPLRVKIYPISKEQHTYVFTYPEEKGQSKITYKRWKSAKNVKVKDITINKEVSFSTDAVSNSIDFEILPNHNYQIVEQ